MQLLFEIIAAENDAVRGLYTREIVGPGKTVDLAFDEDWKQDAVNAGPLPALFLRGVAQKLEESPVSLSLFLGSDHPIAQANVFNGSQDAAFERLKSQNKPQYFFDAGTERHTAMFADRAIAKPCVSCHNDHPDSPKTDWAMGDVMGATTWLYPEEHVSVTEILAAVLAFRDGAKQVYESYLEEAQGFEEPPEVGDCWPRERRCLPSADTFMARFDALASNTTMAALLTVDERGPE